MSKEITKSQIVILMRAGIELWIDEDKADKIMKEYSKGNMIKVEGRLLNTVDVSGFYYPKDLEDMHRRKRGEWQCKYETWHKRNDDCYCGQAPSPKEKKRIEEIEREYYGN